MMADIQELREGVRKSLPEVQRIQDRRRLGYSVLTKQNS